MRVAAVDRPGRHPCLDHAQFAGVVAIFAGDLGTDVAQILAEMIRGDDGVEPQPAGDRFDIEAIGCSGEHQSVAVRAVLRDLRQRALAHIGGDHLVGIAFDMRHQPGAFDIVADHQRLIEFLKPLAADQFKDVGQHQQRDAGQQDQPPRRHGAGNVNQETGIGARDRDRAVHVIDRQKMRHAVSETFAPALRSDLRMGRFGLPCNR